MCCKILQLLVTVLVIFLVLNIKQVKSVQKSNVTITSGLRKSSKIDVFTSTTPKPSTINNNNKPKIIKIPKKTPKKGYKIIPLEYVQEWAKKISDELYNVEKLVVRRDLLLKSFSDIKIQVRNGSAIVERMARDLEQLLNDRADAAERIMRKAEQVGEDFLETKKTVPEEYTYHSSIDLDQIKIAEKPDPGILEVPRSCLNLDKMDLEYSQHFDAHISLKNSSVQVSQEVFDCDNRVQPHIYWSENLQPIFKENYARDSSISYQYFCSYKGFLRHYPAALWSDMFKINVPDEDIGDVYDCRLRPWYVSASGAPRDVLILLDATGSMTNSSNKVVAEQFILSMLSALTDDDQVNVLRFNKTVKSPIECFSDKLVPANHVNSAAMIAALSKYKNFNETDLKVVFKTAVRMLQNIHKTADRPRSCQQAIIMLADSVYGNFTELLSYLDPDGNIRLFILWLHDVQGLRDNTRQFGDYMSCSRDGYFAELITHADVTQQVMKILQVLERPLVSQREKRLRVFSDIYVHIEDPRRSEINWIKKENEEQKFRYSELRRDKKEFMSPQRRMKDHMYQLSLDRYGHYYEGQDVNYRLQISVSVPVFDHTTLENVTIQLMEEKARNATRTYPVNRLLGVAGVDIPIDDLKQILPFHELGAGGSLFIIDHRGNIVYHENHKPVFDGDILKPGYRTVDMLDVEHPAVFHLPRRYPYEWMEFRKSLLLEKTKGTKSMYSMQIFEGGMRALLEVREYHWRRILDHYTAVVVLPKYNRYHAVPDTVFSQKLAEEAFPALHGLDFAIHPDWLYCRHIDQYFDDISAQLLHFVRRRRDESVFAMKKLDYFFSPLPPTLLLKTYRCDEKLMASLCKEAIATEQWAREHEEKGTERDSSSCQLGSTTAFFASESGLTRWQRYHATSQFRAPPEGHVWSGGPSEPLYRRATAAPDTLVVHAPVTPRRNYRDSFRKPPPIGERSLWYTAARTLGNSGTKGGIIGVAGYHFFPRHFEDLVDQIVNFACPEDDPSLCSPRCDGVDWSCVVVDEGGWVLAGGERGERGQDGGEREQDGGERGQDGEPVRRHLAVEFPEAMTALLNHSIFKLHWIHDYQGVCFPWVAVVNSSAPTIPSLLKSAWRTLNSIINVTKNIIVHLTFIIQSGRKVFAETEAERNKRRNHLLRTMNRDNFDMLFDKRVFVNRTKYATCDRSRPFYVFQKTAASLAALQRHPNPCSWPLIGTEIPRTNLLLIAIFKHCPYNGRPVPNPMINERVEIFDEDVEHEPNQTDESKLACWRNRVPLPSRPPTTACYRHNYTEEEGYRQCGPWLPDPEPDIGTSNMLSTSLIITMITSYFILNGT